MIQVIDNLNTLFEFRDIWENLYEQDVRATPFQKFEYTYSCINNDFVAEKELYILAVKYDPSNSWIAIFPFFLDLNKNLRFINYAHTDFCLPLINQQYDHYSLYKEISDFIVHNTSIKGIHFDNLPQDSSLLSFLKPFFKYSIVHDINYYSEIPIIPLEGDRDCVDAFRFISAHGRSNLRKKLKKAEKDYNYIILNNSDGNEFPENEVEILINKMISDGKRTQKYFSEQMITFWKELYNAGILSAALLYSKDEVNACNFVLYDNKHNQYIKWIMLYQDNSYNMLLNILIANQIYQDGGGLINFARGIYDYKLTNFHPDVKPLFCLKIAKTRWGHFKNIVSTAFHYSKPIIKSFLRR